MLKDLEPDTLHALSESLMSVPKKRPPNLKIVRTLPEELNPKAVERAVENFIQETDVKGDALGFFNQTIEGIASATFLNRGGDFWLSHEDGEVVAYLLATVSRDIDGAFTYWISQAWVDRKYRGNKAVKEWWLNVREQAKKYLCRHIVVVAGRSDKAYCRWLGNGLHHYASLLKEDI